MTDVAFWLEVRDATIAGTLTLSYQTSPTTDSSLFKNIATITLTPAASSYVTPIRLAYNPAVPPARWIRWSLQGTGAAWTATFRIFAVAGRTRSAMPAALSLSGWWRGSYGPAGAIWNGSSSGGASGGRYLTPVNQQLPGTAVNGLTPALFDAAASNAFTDPSNTFADLATQSAWTIGCLFKATAAAAAGAQPFNNPAFIADSAGIMGLAFSTAGVNAWQWDGVANRNVAVSCGINAWHFAWAYYDGSNINLSIDGGAFSSVAAANVSSALGGAIEVGRNYNGAAYYSGNIMELMTSNIAYGQSTRDSVRNYINSRYALAI
jgi:hypothetical protein